MEPCMAEGWQTDAHLLEYWKQGLRRRCAKCIINAQNKELFRKMPEIDFTADPDFVQCKSCKKVACLKHTQRKVFPPNHSVDISGQISKDANSIVSGVRVPFYTVSMNTAINAARSGFRFVL